VDCDETARFPLITFPKEFWRTEIQMMVESEFRKESFFLANRASV
jgi:hypothetical protein